MSRLKNRNLNTYALIIAIILSSCDYKNDAESDSSFSLKYEKFTLSNGLEVVLHEDHSDPIVAAATIVHVGSNREKPGKTGFAHFFEHMSFNDSENVPSGSNRKLFSEWGGTRNGGTNTDFTIYYEVVPKDAFEKMLWIDSDRLGYMIKTVTKDALEREKQVVKNEKRQSVDNVAYGYTDEIIRKYLYPEGHPYSWPVLGSSLADLQNASLSDVSEFYENYYGASNATLVISGDIDIEETKKLVEKWFGEIRRGPEVQKLEVEKVNLKESKFIFYQDKLAELPELRMIYPTAKKYDKEQYALEMLGQYLSYSKKSPLYKSVVLKRNLATRVLVYQKSNELAGEFIFRVNANEGVDLDSVKFAIQEGLNVFEKEGISKNELLSIKAQTETYLFEETESVFDKTLTMALDNEFTGDPAYVLKKAKLIEAITQQDVLDVYNKYIKNQNFLITSFIPIGQLDLAVDNSEEVMIEEEVITSEVQNEDVTQGEEASYEKTPTSFERSEPDFTDLPLFEMPEIWSEELNHTGIKVYGIESKEIPLVKFNISLSGGHWLDPINKPGVANLLAELMMEGTANHSPEELEEAIALLGATIKINSNAEDISISASCLAKNFQSTVSLIEEMILEPRWDTTEFNRLKKAVEMEIVKKDADITSIAGRVFYKLVYGDENSMGIPSIGTLESINKISLDDLKHYYSINISPSVTNINVVGYVTNKEVLKAFESLDSKWKKFDVKLPEFPILKNLNEGQVYFIDKEDSKQSLIIFGQLVASALDSNFNNIVYSNEILGGGSAGILTQTLRIEKGYTYGAFSYISPRKVISPFLGFTKVRANATAPSFEIISTILKDYPMTFSENEVEITRSKLIKGDSRKYESLDEKLKILENISKYGRSLNYIVEDQNELMAMTLDDHTSIITNYFEENKMIYLIVGDKKTQFENLKELNNGNVTELDIYGNIQ